MYILQSTVYILLQGANLNVLDHDHHSTTARRNLQLWAKDPAERRRRPNKNISSCVEAATESLDENMGGSAVS